MRTRAVTQSTSTRHENEFISGARRLAGFFPSFDEAKAALENATEAAKARKKRPRAAEIGSSGHRKSKKKDRLSVAHLPSHSVQPPETIRKSSRLNRRTVIRDDAAVMKCPICLEPRYGDAHPTEGGEVESTESHAALTAPDQNKGAPPLCSKEAHDDSDRSNEWLLLHCCQNWFHVSCAFAHEEWCLRDADSRHFGCPVCRNEYSYRRQLRQTRREGLFAHVPLIRDCLGGGGGAERASTVNKNRRRRTEKSKSLLDAYLGHASDDTHPCVPEEGDRREDAVDTNLACVSTNAPVRLSRQRNPNPNANCDTDGADELKTPREETKGRAVAACAGATSPHRASAKKTTSSMEVASPKAGSKKKKKRFLKGGEMKLALSKRKKESTKATPGATLLDFGHWRCLDCSFDNRVVVAKQKCTRCGKGSMFDSFVGRTVRFKSGKEGVVVKMCSPGWLTVHTESVRATTKEPQEEQCMPLPQKGWRQNRTYECKSNGYSTVRACKVQQLVRDKQHASNEEVSSSEKTTTTTNTRGLTKGKEGSENHRLRGKKQQTIKAKKYDTSPPPPLLTPWSRVMTELGPGIVLRVGRAVGNSEGPSRVRRGSRASGTTKTSMNMVLLDDGHLCETANLQRMEHDKASTKQLSGSKLSTWTKCLQTPGEPVECAFAGVQVEQTVSLSKVFETVWYPGVVKCVDPGTNRCSVNFDDGEEEHDIACSELRKPH